MALYGFAINFKDGGTDYAIAAGDTEDQARARVADRFGSNSPVESVEPHDAESIVDDQYAGCAVLSTETGS